jgi:soluble lytic murein transglycosylase-like protein
MRAFAAARRVITMRIDQFFTGIFSRWRSSAAAFLLLFLYSMAHADLWVYVDRQGVTHFATAQVDERYELFYRDDEAGGSVHLRLNADVAGGQRLGLKPMASTPPDPALFRRFANLDTSKGYQAVQERLQAAAAAHNIDYALLKAVVAVESRFDAGIVSPRGAVGLMQVMPGTARHYGVAAGEADDAAQQKLTDPQINIDTGARHLAYLIQLFRGQLNLAVAAYNAGAGAVQRAGNRIPDFPETQDYVKAVMGLYAVFKPVQPRESLTAARIRNSRRIEFERSGE